MRHGPPGWHGLALHHLVSTMDTHTTHTTHTTQETTMNTTTPTPTLEETMRSAYAAMEQAMATRALAEARFFHELNEVGLVFRLADGQTETRRGPVRLAPWSTHHSPTVCATVSQDHPGTPLHLSGPCTYTLDVPGWHQ